LKKFKNISETNNLILVILYSLNLSQWENSNSNILYQMDKY